MSLSLYNTLGRKLQPFQPREAGKAGFYGCGPTVYNHAHIGNLRAYVTHDILARVLRRRGYEVNHVMNITDVGHLTGDDDSGDDKMVKSAGERGKSVLEVAKYYTDAFFHDTERLGIIRPTTVCKATEHIGDMIALIQRIEAAGCTYQAGGNLYFDVSRFPHYGDLGLLRLDDLKAGARTSLDGNKRNPQDFVLWFTKSKFENQALVWDSPWGRGYPGWHIECSAMSIKYLGEQFDIHAGGIDHIQIHHSNEIAQSEAATGKHPWVTYWLHNEFLVLDREKMSKSSGGFITLQTLIDAGYDPLDYRYFLLGGHYRTQLQFSWESLTGARNARKSLVSRLRSAAGAAAPAGRATPASGGETACIAAFDEALDDDLSTPRALASLWKLVKDPSIPPENLLRTALEMDTVLGLNLSETVSDTAAFTARDAIPPLSNHEPGGNTPRVSDTALKGEIETLIAERAAAKKEKQWAKADEIRETLKMRGIILEDGKEGTTWKHA